MKLIRHHLFLCLALTFFVSGTALAQSASPLQQLFLLKEIKPSIKTVGVVIGKANPNLATVQDALKKAQARTGVTVVMAIVDNLNEIAPKVRELTRTHGAQALWVVENDKVVDSDIARTFLVKTSAQEKLPLLVPSSDWVKKGACISILQQAENLHIVVNKPIAEALSISIPAKYQDRTEYLSLN